MTLSKVGIFAKLSITTCSIECYYAEYHYANSRFIIMLSVTMPSVVMLSIVAPFFQCTQKIIF